MLLLPLEHYLNDYCVQQLKERDSKLEEAGDLHRFLRSVDHFQAWLTKTQTDVASEGTHNTSNETINIIYTWNK